MAGTAGRVFYPKGTTGSSHLYHRRSGTSSLCWRHTPSAAAGGRTRSPPLERTTGAPPRRPSAQAQAARFLLGRGWRRRELLPYSATPADVYMELGGQRGRGSAVGLDSATPKPRQEPRTGAEAGTPGLGALGDRRFLFCLYLVGFLVSAEAGRQVQNSNKGTFS